MFHMTTITLESVWPYMANYYFKSDEEEWRQLTELAKCVHSAVFYPGKSKEMYKELFFYALVSDLYRIGTQYWLVHKFGYQSRYKEGKMVSEHLYFQL